MGAEGNKKSCHDHFHVTKIAPAAERLDLAAVREKLSKAQGPEYWRSLEELAETPGFTEMMHREFPRHASEWDDAFSRRGFMKLMGASLALAGLSGCTKQPLETIVPYVQQPEALVPGRPMFFATAMTVSGVARPLLVESHEGRPTKVEGNPQHPASGGAADVFAQASVLGLYDPDRSQTVTYAGEVRPWGALVAAMQKGVAGQRASQGAGLRILTETVVSPTLAAQIRAILQQYPQAKWHQWEPVNRDNERAGTVMAFGQPATAHYQLAKAEVVLSLDADFMSPGGHPDFMRLSRDFISRRRLQGETAMNRLYAIESTPTNTGAKADNRVRVRGSEVELVARAIAAKLGLVGGAPALENIRSKFVDAVAAELQANRGRCVVVPGAFQSPELHALAHAMNQALGAVGNTVVFTEPVEANPVDHMQSIKELATDMEEGRVSMLVIVGGNPVYDAPADLNFAEKMNKVALRVHLSQHVDETSYLCHWQVPQTHYLEEWSDARSYDGTVSIVQPLIQPLYGGKSAHEFLATLTPNADQSGYEVVRTYWKSQRPGADFEMQWRRWLHDGFLAGTALPPKQVTARPPQMSAQVEPAVRGVEINFRPDPAIYDGRFANNGWLMELPRQLTSLTWDNAVLVSPAMAEQMHLQYDDVVELEFGGRKVKGSVFILPGHPIESLSVYLGWGRQRSGRSGTGRGFNAYALRTSSAPWTGGGISIQKTGERWHLATTKAHHTMNVQELGDEAVHRAVLRTGTLEEYRQDPHFAQHMAHAPSPEMTLYPAFEYKGHKWGMAIDLNACIGCNSCVVACQAENNIPVVGKEQVIAHREMHWLRIDSYHHGTPDNPDTHFMPVPCMHCENAPCEVVCPVGATAHSSEGLNDMVYNRCVGTRYCGNNCPYKVRRFNFLLFSDFNTPSLQLMYNPDVTVRSRGVMEKCTYCVQRINRVRIDAETQDRPIRDGEIQTACQQSCPTQAIIFGDLNDKASKVAKLQADARNYGLLEEINTRPRTTYLAAVRNPNPELGPPAGAAERKEH